MTEQNTAYRNDADQSTEDDPLAELARIVAGEPSQNDRGQNDQQKSFKDKQTDLRVVEPGSGGEFDIESELLKELGEAPSTSSSRPVAKPSGTESVEASDALSDKEFATELASSVSSDAKPNDTSQPVDTMLSLEEQLMAELSADPVSNEAEISKPDSEPASDPIVDEAVANAVRDVETATANMASLDDRHKYAVSASDNQFKEAQASIDPLDQMLSEGFEDLLQEEIEGFTINPSNGLQDNPEGAVSPQTSHTDFDFDHAFEAELQNSIPEQPSVEAGAVQDELALENNFAKAFADELNGDEAEFEARQSQPVHPGQPFDSDYGAVAAAPSLDQTAFDEQYPEDQSAAVAQRSGNGFRLAVVALCGALVLGLGVVGWGYFSGSGETGEPPVISADTSPAKIKPENPGGEAIANQDNQVYNQVAGTESNESQQEELITSRAEPVEIPAKTSDRLVPDATSQVDANAPLGLSPKRVRTLTVKPDGTIIPSAVQDAGSENQAVAMAQAGEETGVSLQPELASPEPPTAISSDEQAAAADGTIGIDGAVSTGNLAVPQPSPLPAAQQLAEAAPTAAPEPQAAVPVAPEPQPSQAADPNAPTQIAALGENQPAAQVPSVTSSEWKIQVSSQRSREAAEASFNNLQRRFSSVLGGRSAVIESADIEGKGTFYRTKVLAESRTEANQLCNRLKSAGGSCFVSR